MRSRAIHDFDLHGIVGVRLVDATDADVAKVTKQLGPLRRSLQAEPDIVVRFVDSVTSLPLMSVGLGDTGYNADGFFVLRGDQGVRGHAMIPFADIGRVPEIVCERALPAVPHLLAIVNLTALSKDVLPLHASAFSLDGLGVLVTGWAKSGKTETLLAAMAAGASYVGDEWVYITPDRQMWGVPEPIRLWAWHLDQQPRLLAARSLRERVGLSAWGSLSRLARSVASSPLPGAGLARRGAPTIGRQAYLQVPPADLFGMDRLDLRGNLDAAIMVFSHESPETTVRAAGPREISGRMRASLADERAPFLAHFRQFLYASPDTVCDAVCSAEEREARLLARLFDDQPAAVVAHPYPCDIAELGRAVIGAAQDLESTTHREGVAS